MREVHKKRFLSQSRSLPWLAALGLLSGAPACSSTSSKANGNNLGQMGDDGATDGDDGSTGDDGSISSDDGDTTADGAPASQGDSDDASPASDDGGLGGSCISALYDIYVQRTDGALLFEGPSENPIIDSATGLPLAGATSVQWGVSHGCASAGGAATCWQTDMSAGNTSGQLGNGTTTAVGTLYRSTPVLTAPSAPLTGVTSVADGNSNIACAVTSGGSVYCWGDLTWLTNNGTKLLSGFAQRITLDGSTPLTGALQVAVGPSEACAIVHGTPNTVWCWGANESGELGQGDTTTRQYPVKVLGFTNPTEIIVARGAYSGDPQGNAAAICVLDGSSVRCWGDNSFDASGDNSMTSPTLSPSPVVVQAGTVLSGVVALGTGQDAFDVLRTDGTLWRWGYLANNTAPPYASNYGVTNVLAVGFAGGTNAAAQGPRYVTGDGVYHVGMNAQAVNCSPL